MHQVNRRIARDILRRDTGEAYTLIVDPYILEANKYEAHKTYLGVKGYRPVVATLKELGVCIAHEFRAGNDNSAKQRVIRRAFKRMPKGKRIARVLLDAEYYSNDVMEYLDARPLQWAIGVDKDESVMAASRSRRRRGGRSRTGTAYSPTERSPALCMPPTRAGYRFGWW